MEVRTFSASRRKNLVLLAIVALFTIIGVAMILNGNPMGWLVAGFFGWGIPVFVLNSLPGAAWLRLDAEGVTYASMYRKSYLSWDDIDFCYPRSISGTKMIGLEMSQAYLADKPVASKTSKAFGGALPETYGMNGQELADIMNGYIANHRDR